MLNELKFNQGSKVSSFFDFWPRTIIAGLDYIVFSIWFARLENRHGAREISLAPFVFAKVVSV